MICRDITEYALTPQIECATTVIIIRVNFHGLRKKNGSIENLRFPSWRCASCLSKCLKIAQKIVQFIKNKAIKILILTNMFDFIIICYKGLVSQKDDRISHHKSLLEIWPDDLCQCRNNWSKDFWSNFIYV